MVTLGHDGHTEQDKVVPVLDTPGLGDGSRLCPLPVERGCSSQTTVVIFPDIILGCDRVPPARVDRECVREGEIMFIYIELRRGSAKWTQGVSGSGCHRGLCPEQIPRILKIFSQKSRLYRPARGGSVPLFAVLQIGH